MNIKTIQETPLAFPTTLTLNYTPCHLSFLNHHPCELVLAVVTHQQHSYLHPVSITLCISGATDHIIEK